MIKIRIFENVEEKKQSDSAADKNDEKTLKRIADEHVGYIEIDQKASGICCGDCKGMNKKGFCENPDVQAYVSANHGCCNYFSPKQAKIVFPKE